MTDQTCPCTREQPYRSCCEPFHLNAAPAPTAERLMRSRYSAFCLGKLDYLITTLHPSKRQSMDRDSLARTLESTTWTGLRILDTENGGEHDKTGQVEFVATFQEDGEALSNSGGTGRLHERSQFVKEGGRWFYLSGHYDKLLPLPKPGRNDPCWCGSGKKYKKCHA